MDINISDNYAKLCLRKWSKESQVIKFIEETSELNQKLAKYLLYGFGKDWKEKDNQLQKNIQSEIADVIVTLNTLILIFDEHKDNTNLVSQISKQVTFKILRLMDKLKL